MPTCINYRYTVAVHFNLAEYEYGTSVSTDYSLPVYNSTRGQTAQGLVRNVYIATTFILVLLRHHKVKPLRRDVATLQKVASVRIRIAISVNLALPVTLGTYNFLQWVCQ